VYRELAYDGPAPRSLWRIAAEVDGASERVIRLGTFSKTLAPGLRCGWITSGAARVREFTALGVFDSGGCPSQFTACLCARLVREGVYDENVARVRAAYKQRRDALIDGLRAALPDGCAVTSPSGGLFAWVTLPDDLVAGDLLAAGEAHGIAFFDGARFSIAGHDWASACTGRTTCAKARRGWAALWRRPAPTAEAGAGPPPCGYLPTAASGTGPRCRGARRCGASPRCPCGLRARP
jgi:DNA-binding transcriptional MocR family regulator